MNLYGVTDYIQLWVSYYKNTTPHHSSSSSSHNAMIKTNGCSE